MIDFSQCYVSNGLSSPRVSFDSFATDMDVFAQAVSLSLSLSIDSFIETGDFISLVENICIFF